MWPQVQINQENLLQGATKEIERTLLFIGIATADTPVEYINKVLPVNTQTDFSQIFADSIFKSDVLAAMANAGQNWNGYIYTLPVDYQLSDIEFAIMNAQPIASVEGIVLSMDIDTKEKINLLNKLRSQIIAKYGRWQWFIACAGGLAEDETWSELLARFNTLQSGIAAPSVQLVPRLYGHEPGVLAGRLCNRSVSIADSPARVRTGALLDLGSDEKPKDHNGVELGLDTLQALEKARFSVPMWHPDYDGMYWADGRTLDVEGGDFQVIERMRIIDKGARKMRIKAIAKIADRSLNTSPASIAAHKQYFAKVWREMSISTQINGIAFPGEVQSPQDDDVQIVWKDMENVEIYTVGRPHACPKGISVTIMLNTALEI